MKIRICTYKRTRWYCWDSPLNKHWDNPCPMKKTKQAALRWLVHQKIEAQIDEYNSKKERKVLAFKYNEASDMVYDPVRSKKLVAMRHFIRYYRKDMHECN